MPRVPESVTKEQYLLKSTFFYNKLSSNGYFELFMKVQKYANIEGKNLNWEKKASWNISEDAWNVLKTNGISPVLVFVHPKVLKLYPSFLKYYRSVAMIPQKGLKAISHVSNVDSIEDGTIDSNRLSQDTISKLVNSINEVLKLIFCNLLNNYYSFCALLYCFFPVFKQSDGFKINRFDKSRTNGFVIKCQHCCCSTDDCYNSFHNSSD